MKLAFQLLFFLLLSTNNIWSQSDGEDKELTKLVTELELLKKEDKLREAYTQANTIAMHLQKKGRWKASLDYLREQSKLGKEMNEPDMEAIPLVNILDMENVLFKQIENYEGRTKDLLRFLQYDDSKVEPQTKGRILMMYGVGKSLESKLDSSAYYLEKAVLEFDKNPKLLNYSISERIRLSSELNKAGKYIPAIDALLESESMIDSTISPTAEYRVYRGLGRIFSSIQDYDKAEIYFDKALEVGLRSDDSDKISETQLGLGEIYNKTGQNNDAIENLLPAIASIKTSKFTRLLPRTYGVTAYAYMELGELEKAKSYIDSVLMHKDYVVHNGMQDFHYQLLADYYIRQKNPTKARQAFANIQNRERRKNDILYKINKLEGNYQKANYYLELKTAEQDSVRTANEALKVQRIESEFNRQKQDNKIVALNELTIAQDRALAIRNTALTLGAIMLGILGLLLFSLYRLFLKNQENQKELTRQNNVISKALEQNKILMKEIHHRVKNNLQVVSSLLSMQARKTKDGDTKDALNSSRTRVQSMSILHQNLYQGDNLTGVNIDEYLDKVVDNIIETYKIQENISFEIDIDPVSLDVDTLVPLGLIANELICNALKYAFVGREKGTLKVRFKEKGSKLVLTVADDGIGFEGDEIPKKEGSMGARLITSFTERLEGEIAISHDNGTDISIVFDKEKLGL